MSVAAGVSDVAIAVREKLRGKISQTKVKRYWPGKAPDWAEEQDQDADLRTAEPGRPAVEDFRVLPNHDDARLRRLAESRRDREEAVARHRQIRAAEIIETRDETARAERAAREEEENEEDDEEIERRRQRVREKTLQRLREEELPQEEEDEEEEEEEGSEYETDSEEEDGRMAMIKPIFVPKAERETVAERERLEAEELAMQEALKKRLEMRQVETRQMVVEEVRKEEERERGGAGEGDGEEEDVDTDDEANEAEEYEAWKVREIARIRRDREDREAMAKEREEIEALRGMNEEERRDWERKHPKQTSVAPKKKWKFMQKYFHKGAFFQDMPDDRGGTAGGDEIYGRDFSAPVGEDKMDRSILPKVMQVKNFGRSGRTKWTHLAEEDTTEWDNPWTFNDPMRAKYNNKMAGMNRPLEKPKGSKKLKDYSQK